MQEECRGVSCTTMGFPYGAIILSTSVHSKPTYISQAYLSESVATGEGFAHCYYRVGDSVRIQEVGSNHVSR
jgi:hypothetical protein